jgi:AraC-like DNA-binding protein
MTFDFEDILSALSVLLSFLLALYLFSAKNNKKVSNHFFAWYMVINAIDSGAGFSGTYLYPYFPSLGLFLSNLLFLHAPLLFLYVSSLVYADFKLKPVHLLHTLPFIAINILLIPNYYLLDYKDKILFFEKGVHEANWIVPLIYIIIHVQFIGYVFACYRIVYRYKKLLHENYSNPTLVNQQWLIRLLNVITALMIISLLKNYSMFSDYQKVYNYAVMTTNFAGLIFLCWLVLKAMHSPNLFSGIDSGLQLAKNLAKKNDADKSIKLENPEIKKLKDYMAEKEPYLDASLSMHDLATELDIQVRELSVLINHQLNQNFFDFVNEYRINKAKEFLQDPNKKDLTILEILYEVGFNSKSSFNTAFKKYTNFTPTQYRKKHLKSAA